MRKLSLIFTLICACGTSEVSTLKSLEADLVIDSTELEITGITYIEEATRTWLPGCMSYDVLQGSGWYPSVFRHELDLQKEETLTAANLPAKGPLAKACNAKASNKSGIYIVKQTGEQSLYGVVNFKFQEDQEALKSKSSCQLATDPSGIDYLECEALVLDPEAASTIKIYTTN